MSFFDEADIELDKTHLVHCSLDFLILLVTSTNSNSELRKDFLDRKKVLKSLEANSSISPQNYVIPARYHTKQHPNVWVGKAKIHLHHPTFDTRTFQRYKAVSRPLFVRISALQYYFATL